MSSDSKYILGVYDNEVTLLKAVEAVRKGGIKIHEVFSPFPVHGLDDALGYRRSRLPIAAFLFGLLGTSLALTMQIGMMTVDWPMIIGGKDYLPLPSFIPVSFELTVLLASFGMVGTFFVVSNLKPWGKPKIFDIRSTDDKHIMAIDVSKNKLAEADIKKSLKDSGASEVNEKVF
jgi:hypothetical protein